MPDDDVLSVLHVLRLRGTSGADVVAARCGLDDVVVERTFAAARDAGWVQVHRGRLAGWTLTAAGRREGERRLAEQLDAAGARPAVESGYQRFLGLNGELLSVCTDWQVVRRGGRELANDHADPRHDRAVLGRLSRLHDAASPVVGALAGALARFGGYGPRLELAHARVQAGDHQWLTRPMIDSYHTVWFELHEDLLATLGRERTQERSA